MFSWISYSLRRVVIDCLDTGFTNRYFPLKMWPFTDFLKKETKESRILVALLSQKLEYLTILKSSVYKLSFDSKRQGLKSFYFLIIFTITNKLLKLCLLLSVLPLALWPYTGLRNVEFQIPLRP